MSGWLIGIALGALTVMVLLLAVVAKKLSDRLNETREQLVSLEQQFITQHQQNQNDIMAIGQRMLEADKLVRKFSARMDGIESNHFTEVQYGQLESLISKGVSQQDEASSAEVELLSLLRRQQQKP